MTHPFAIQELRGPNDGFEPELNIRPRKYVSAFPLPRTIPADHFRSFIIRADYKNVIPASGPGRNSVRVRSVKTYTSHLAVCAHRASPFPPKLTCTITGLTCATCQKGARRGLRCGGQPNRTGRTAERCAHSIHSPSDTTLVLMNSSSILSRASTMPARTSPSCTPPPAARCRTIRRPGTSPLPLPSYAFTACLPALSNASTSKHWNCDYAVDGNAGCGVAMPGDVSFGPPFNANGGGWFAMERTATYIRVWFWPRDVGAPAALVSGAGTLDTTTFVRSPFSFVQLTRRGLMTGHAGRVCRSRTTRRGRAAISRST